VEPSFPVLSLASLRLQPWRRSEGEALDEVVPEDRLRINLAKAFGNAFTRFIRVASELRSTVHGPAPWVDRWQRTFDVPARAAFPGGSIGNVIENVWAEPWR